MANVPPVSRRIVGSLAATTLWACGAPPATPVDAGVAAELARRRATTISDVRYDVRFSIPAERAAPVEGRIEAHFRLGASGPVVLDFAAPPEHVHAVTVAGVPARHEVRDEHILIPDVSAGPVSVGVAFTAGDGSLNRQDDFLYTLFVPDRARVAFPLFDQPDLKARFRLTVEIPESWQGVANGPVLRRTVDGGRATVHFAETAPISSYLFAFAAGAFQVEAAERDGRHLAVYHRETDPDRLDRNLDALFDLHATALAWLETYTGIPYPFGKLDFVLVPSFQYGGMEHPGSILYRAEALLLDESATQNAYLGRASLIAHETAHQWFGNLVTMPWFDDVWMKETFANFMAAKIVNPTFPDVDHDLRFLLAHYPSAYAVDRTAGATPIRQPLDNLNEAGTLYGPMIYDKAPIVVRHLERLIGEDTLRAGLRTYLSRHAHANASWRELIAVLDQQASIDLGAWSRTWVEEPGRPRIAVEMETAGGMVTSLTVTQTDPAGRDRLWPQRIDLVLGARDGTETTLEVLLNDAVVPVPEAAGRPAPAFVLASGGGVAYGRMALDGRSRRFLLDALPTIESRVTRAAAWLALWDAVLEGEVEADAFIDLALGALPVEPIEQNVSLVLGFVRTAYWRLLDPARRRAVAGTVEAALWAQVDGAERPTTVATYVNAYRDVAVTPAGIDRLRRLWLGELTVRGLSLSERDRTTLALELAVRDIDGRDAMLAQQRDEIDNPDRRAAFEFVLPAVSADPAVRRRFFEQLGDVDRRARETWVLRGLRYLHHPLRARDSERFIRPGLDLLEEIQATGDIFFPDRWLGATLGGHQTPGAAAIVRGFLDARPDLPVRLRAKVDQAADMLYRAAAISDGD